MPAVRFLDVNGFFDRLPHAFRITLFFLLVELIVPMTWIIDFKELQDEAMKHEDDSIVGNLHQKTEILRGYKLACIQPRVMEAVLGVLMRPLNVEYRYVDRRPPLFVLAFDFFSLHYDRTNV